MAHRIDKHGAENYAPNRTGVAADAIEGKVVPSGSAVLGGGDRKLLASGGIALHTAEAGTGEDLGGVQSLDVPRVTFEDTGDAESSAFGQRTQLGEAIAKACAAAGYYDAAHFLKRLLLCKQRKFTYGEVKSVSLVPQDHTDGSVAPVFALQGREFVFHFSEGTVALRRLAAHLVIAGSDSELVKGACGLRGNVIFATMPTAIAMATQQFEIHCIRAFKKPIQPHHWLMRAVAENGDVCFAGDDISSCVDDLMHPAYTEIGLLKPGVTVGQYITLLQAACMHQPRLLHSMLRVHESVAVVDNSLQVMSMKDGPDVVTQWFKHTLGVAVKCPPLVQHALRPELPLDHETTELRKKAVIAGGFLMKSIVSTAMVQCSENTAQTVNDLVALKMQIDANAEYFSKSSLASKYSDWRGIAKRRLSDLLCMLVYLAYLADDGVTPLAICELTQGEVYATTDKKCAVCGMDFSYMHVRAMHV